MQSSMMERRSAERDTTDMRTKRTASAQGLDRSNEGKHPFFSYALQFLSAAHTHMKHSIVYVQDLKESLRFNGEHTHWKELFKNI